MSFPDNGTIDNPMPKIRLDLLLVERGLAESRAKAQALVMAGQVRVAGQVVITPSARVASDVSLDVDAGPRFVSRGGDKLQAALDAFSLTVEGRVCADVGSSTGGFTDCLLQHGAARVYAVDVGKGLLHWKLRTDPRVVVMEGTNARYVASLPEAVDLVVIDASFISLKILLPVVKSWFAVAPASSSGKEGAILALIKPQFEAGRRDVARGRGVIRDPALHQAVVDDILAFARAQGLTLLGQLKSPVLGPKGNVEFLVWLGVPPPPGEG
jgi:23S rRNA (cytidine1920-2'-O)/16S rRNA (cytidine1409-2'-O)-methyltransferase